jgi:hypothetical protein
MVDVRDDGYVTKIHVENCLSGGHQSRKRDLYTRGHVNFEKYATAMPKKKCCRSKPRCKRCPLVLHKVRKAEQNGIRGKKLKKVFDRARKA